MRDFGAMTDHRACVQVWRIQWDRLGPRRSQRRVQVAEAERRPGDVDSDGSRGHARAHNFGQLVQLIQQSLRRLAFGNIHDRSVLKSKMLSCALVVMRVPCWNVWLELQSVFHMGVLRHGRCAPYVDSLTF